MQIHELNTFTGDPGSGDFLAIDDGSTTKKIPAPNLGISTAMTQAEAETGTSTSKRVVTPSVFKSTVLAIAKTISDTWLAKDTVHVTSHGTNGEWYFRRWSDGTVEAWCTHSHGSQTGTAWVSPFYYYDTTLTIPLGIFTTSRPPTMALLSSGNKQWIPVGVGGTPTSSSIAARWMKPSTSAQTLIGTYYVRN